MVAPKLEHIRRVAQHGRRGALLGVEQRALGGGWDAPPRPAAAQAQRAHGRGGRGGGRCSTHHAAHNRAVGERI